MPSPTVHWSTTATVLILIEITISVLMLGAAFLVQSRKGVCVACFEPEGKMEASAILRFSVPYLSIGRRPLTFHHGPSLRYRIDEVTSPSRMKCSDSTP